jgi:hypothetical protein
MRALPIANPDPEPIQATSAASSMIPATARQAGSAGLVPLFSSVSISQAQRAAVHLLMTVDYGWTAFLSYLRHSGDPYLYPISAVGIGQCPLPGGDGSARGEDSAV